MAIQISHSKIELYDTCSWKYKLQHVDRWRSDKTYSALLFGSAIDEALNYVLTCVKNKETIHEQKAKKIFYDKMCSWDYNNPLNELIYFKYELPDNVEHLTNGEKQKAVWGNLHDLGIKIIETYINEIIPEFQSINEVQVKHEIKNADGDNLIIILDFIGTLKDGRRVLFDNKTSSDIKKYYNNDSVAKSKQLALYTEYYPDHYSGYIALSKKPDRHGKIKWTMVVDKISEEKKAEVFENIEVKTQMIKDEVFEKNEKSCFNFGKRCEFYSLCKFGNPEGLIQKK